MKKNILVTLVAVLSVIAGVFLQQWLKPDFKTVSGDTYQWRQLQGQWVVVNYFAEWCAPCLREVPELNEFYKESDIPLFGISFDGEPDVKMREIATQYGMEFPIISAEFEASLPMVPPASLPATFIIDGQGQVRKVLMGEQSHDKLVKTIQVLQRL